MTGNEAGKEFKSRVIEFKNLLNVSKQFDNMKKFQDHLVYEAVQKVLKTCKLIIFLLRET